MLVGETSAMSCQEWLDHDESCPLEETVPVVFDREPCPPRSDRLASWAALLHLVEMTAPSASSVVGREEHVFAWVRLGYGC
jgi:hypothetical protein